MNLARLAGAGAVATLALCLPQACGGPVFVLGEPGDSGAAPLDGSPPTDAGAPDALGGGDASGDAGEGGTDGGASGGIVYVSPTGSDLATGLDPLHPKRTIVAALAEAGTLTGLPQVHVCAGTYSETKLTVSTDVALTGSYSCDAWTRTATYGYPTFDGKNQTTIENAVLTSQPATLLVSGSVTSATVIDGFAIVGGSSAANSSIGVHVTSASPTIMNDTISGGSGTGSASSAGSYGLTVDGTAAPEITLSVIDGGSGSGFTGSIGASLNTTGAVSLHGAVVVGGTGTLAASSGGNFASIGVHVRSSLAASAPLYDLVVAGSDSTGVAASSAGVYVDGSGASAGASGVSAEIAGCDISGGTGTGAASSSGVYVDTSGGTVTIVDDRIYGGSQAATPSQTYGVAVTAASSIIVVDSMIHAGTVPAASGGSAVGIDLASTASPTIVFDTIYTGAAGGAAVVLNAGVTSATITDDLLVGSDQSTLGDLGVVAAECSGAIGLLSYSAFANFGELYACSLADGGTTSATTTAQLGTDLGSSTTTGDVVLESTCVIPAGCAVVSDCPQTGESCPTSLFGSSWSASNDGTSSLLPTTEADGGVVNGDWSLYAGAPCAVTQGGTPLANITTDIDGRTRTSEPTMGAVQYASTKACTPTTP